MNNPTIQLTEDQKNAYEGVVSFLASDENFLILSGAAGCGKTTLLKHILQNINKDMEMLEAVLDSFVPYTIQLCATTNKAAHAIKELTGVRATTIHSELNLIVRKHGSASSLVQRRKPEVTHNLLIIDEAFMITEDLLEFIIQEVSPEKNNKVIFVGDPYQLLGVNEKSPVISEYGFREYSLETVVRQAKGNPIIDLATSLREAIKGSPLPRLKSDGVHIQVLDRQDFNSEILNEFVRPDWTHFNSKILTYTNNKSIQYNQAISERITGTQKFLVNDFAINNKYTHSIKTGEAISTDATVQIKSIDDGDLLSNFDKDIKGSYVSLYDYSRMYFIPDNLEEIKELRSELARKKMWETLSDLDSLVLDLRAAYSSTVHKSQGSTYDKVFIDLLDIQTCKDYVSMLRLIYVAITRAKDKVYICQED